MSKASVTEKLADVNASAPCPGSAYWPIWKHMSDNHGLTLLDSECEDICRVVYRMHKRKYDPSPASPGKCAICRKYVADLQVKLWDGRLVCCFKCAFPGLSACNCEAICGKCGHAQSLHTNGKFYCGGRDKTCTCTRFRKRHTPNGEVCDRR